LFNNKTKKTNIGTKLSHFNTRHNGEMTRVKNKRKIKKFKRNSKKNIKKILKKFKNTRN